MFALSPKKLVALSALPLLFACGHAGTEDFASSEDALLPNSTMFDVGHDGSSYRLIAENFQARGLDMHVDLSSFAPAWPITDTKSVVLNRVGTPIVYSSFGYYHTGFDVMRSDSGASPDVLAPHDGLALVFDWSGHRLSSSTVTVSYNMVVAIYDPVSHVITQMMHVGATPALIAADAPIAVTKGEVIGKLAPAPVPSDSARLAHIQMSFVDGEGMKLLNPAPLFGDAYHDAVLPTAQKIYLADADANIQSEFASGDLDVVLEAFDRDDDSGRNLEISAIAFDIKDQDGALLTEQPRCNLDNLYESLSPEPTPFRATDLIDFGSAKGQVGGGWPLSDVDNPNRTFRYALTNLAVDNGRCTVRTDGEGFLHVGDGVTKLVVNVTIWDANGNESQKSLELNRAAAPPPPVTPPVDPNE